MTQNLAINLLGGFSVQLDAQPVRAFRAAKTRALLAYLAVEADREHSRAILATLLWGELPDAAAKTNLRIELSNLKGLLGSHPALEITRNHVCLHSALTSIDVQLFQRAVAGFLALPLEAQGVELAKLAGALELYQGELLAGFYLNDAIEFEDWQLIRREQLHEQMMLGLTTLQTRYAEQGQWAEQARAARRQLALVPWTESAHRSLMQALAAQGQIQEALAQFERCRDLLQSELGVEPSLSTLELATRLRGNGPNQQPVQQNLQHNLAAQLKAFVGRKQEVAQLHALVKAEQLVTILGIGGVGKSHLAQTVARQLLHDFADGVWFVPLANIEMGDVAAASCALAIAAAIGFQLTNLQEPVAELVTHLAPKHLLIVLDNCEHLREVVATLIFTTLQQAPRVHILATSRVRLLLEGETVVPLAGLPEPEAYTLFVERARRVVPAFAAPEEHPPSPATRMRQEGEVSRRAENRAESREENYEESRTMQRDILKICEQVAGLPLGIELAASWVEHYSLAEIGQSLMEMAVAPQQSDGVLQRHHRLSSVFEFSWQLLNPRQQQILAYLSIFRGGFDRAAVTTVAESTLNDLSTLMAHSLVQRVSAGRYDLHPLIQEFAGGKLLSTQAEPLAGRYVQHYFSLLATKPRPRWKSELLHDFENLRKAWQQAVQAKQIMALQQIAGEFGEYMHRFGFVVDANQLFATAVAQFESGFEPGFEADSELGFEANSELDGEGNRRELVALLLDQQAIFLRGHKGLVAVSALQQRVLRLSKDPQLLARSHQDLANYYAEIGEWERADYHFDCVEALAQATGDLAMYITSVEGRIHINAIQFRGDYAQGIARLEELLRLIDHAPTPVENEERHRRYILQSLTLIAIRYGDYALSLRYSQQALALFNEYGLRRIHLLLNIALAEQFAGMYPQAVAHNREALALAEEIGDTDEIALLKANLCLTLRQGGDPVAALEYGQAAIALLTHLGNRRIEGQARNRVGHTLAVLERWEEAYAAYGEALRVWADMQHPNRWEAVAGRAMAALQLGQWEEALRLANEVMDFVNTAGLAGIVEPVRLLLNCEAVFKGLGQTAHAQAALSQAQAWVQTIAARISDAQMRESFLNHRPDNQWLQARLALA